MRKDMEANPFKTPESVHKANVARAKAERESRGPGNPGVIGDLINNTIGERVMDSDIVTEAAERAFGDPDAIIGSLATSAAERLQRR